ncbi:MAG: SOS response-associated peptidase [Anaerolineales bacterium]|nr:SOS response-associated peptidase [Anaerolineales bacterium]
MCGRFVLTADPSQLRAAFPGLAIPDDIPPRYNIAPSQPVAVIPNDGKNRLDFFVWGLIPSWAKDPKIGNQLINARAETVAEKPSFRAAFRRRRCLILADGFYEWKKEAGQKTKTPLLIRLKSGGPFAMAGLWESWHAPDGSNILSCTILTTQPNDLVKEIHNRMPVILPLESYPLWLDPGEAAPGQLEGLLKPYPASQMTAFPVSTLVNDPANDLAACIAPAA